MVRTEPQAKRPSGQARPQRQLRPGVSEWTGRCIVTPTLLIYGKACYLRFMLKY